MPKSVVYWWEGGVRVRREEGTMVRRAVVRLGISSALADDQPLSITRCALDRCKAAGGMRSRK